MFFPILLQLYDSQYPITLHLQHMVLTSIFTCFRRLYCSLRQKQLSVIRTAGTLSQTSGQLLLQHALCYQAQYNRQSLSLAAQKQCGSIHMVLHPCKSVKVIPFCHRELPQMSLHLRQLLLQIIFPGTIGIIEINSLTLIPRAGQPRSVTTRFTEEEQELQS